MSHNDGDDNDEDEDLDDRAPYDPDPDYPRPTCCENGTTYIRARYSGLYCQNDEEYDAVLAAPPDWALVLSGPMAGFPGLHATHQVTIMACPWCASRLPGLRRKQPPTPAIIRITDGGYYCGTCEERLMSCRCRRPEVLWEVAP